jgi:hypothetical protein
LFDISDRGATSANFEVPMIAESCVGEANDGGKLGSSDRLGFAGEATSDPTGQAQTAHPASERTMETLNCEH